MFVPRSLRLKGVREAPRPRAAKVTPRAPADGRNDPEDALVEAMQKTSTGTSSPVPEAMQLRAKAAERGSNFTTKPVTPEYLGQLAAGLELIFSDYAHHEERRAAWLHERYRTVEGAEQFIHLAAVLEHPYIAMLKPEATQKRLLEALQAHPSKALEVSSNGYYVRRKPATYPSKFLPENSFDEADDNGLAFWDQRTIYVEPHMRNMCPTPAKVAYWLKNHGQLRHKWLPIQAVHTLWNSCAFVVLSGSVMHDDVWRKWREAGVPQDWKIMTKVEHTRRTAEYVALLEQQNPRGMRRRGGSDSSLPAIARPAVLSWNTKIIPGYFEAVKPKGKRKRQKKKLYKSRHANEGDLEPDVSDHAAEEPQENEPSRKRRV
ncbi:hypothetical protein T440DRAFT_468164 [Plenodomus tracheiphilus IPT5]|uniref:Uncharacterized protein n=1 Tax=Plenodomus tracheiphilus IPT5 TaxID=1408161 RepID=A0A6A7B6D8_9PLEO|nr:hypothetical protein T440DRAFT_468164 [Plenodomus tracheiphilus IPT5]